MNFYYYSLLTSLLFTSVESLVGRVSASASPWKPRTGSISGKGRVALLAEPIPVGTVILEPIARSVDRAARSYPIALDSVADGPPVRYAPS